MNDTAWKFAAGAAAALGAFLVRKVTEGTWQFATGEAPPHDPTAPDTDWGDALTWAAIMGLATGVARVVSRRGAAEAWKSRAGEYPARQS